MGMHWLEDIREVPEFAEPVPTPAKVGSALFYSSYLIHASVPFENKRKQRALWTLSMERGDVAGPNWLTLGVVLNNNFSSLFGKRRPLECARFSAGRSWDMRFTQRQR